MAREPKISIEIEAEWALMLELSGFEDIEDVSRDLLKEWHSTKFLSERSLIRQQERERYEERMKNLINDPEFPVICYLIAATHGNSKITPIDVRTIVDLHIYSGLTERKIAAKINRPKTTINRTLKKIQEWMQVS